MISVIIQLQEEIARIESLALFYETQALAKRKALWELIQLNATKSIEPIVVEQKLSVTSMVREALTQFNGGMIPYNELRNKVMLKYPADKKRISNGFWHSCKQLTNEGKNIEPCERIS